MPKVVPPGSGWIRQDVRVANSALKSFHLFRSASNIFKKEKLWRKKIRSLYTARRSVGGCLRTKNRTAAGINPAWDKLPASCVRAPFPSRTEAAQPATRTSERGSRTPAGSTRAVPLRPALARTPGPQALGTSPHSCGSDGTRDPGRLRGPEGARAL